MPHLNGTKIYRAGVTAPRFKLETTNSSFSVNVENRTLDIRFTLASKGGGNTAVLLQIGEGDLYEIIKELAKKMPEQVNVLSECAAIANKNNLKTLKKMRMREQEKKLLKAIMGGT